MKEFKIHATWILLITIGIQIVASAKLTTPGTATSGTQETPVYVDDIIDVIRENTKGQKDDDSDIPKQSIDEIIVNAANSSKEFEFFFDENKKMLKLEYDMIYSMDELKEKSRRKRTAGIKHGRQGGYRWTKNHVYYDYAYRTFTNAQKNQIQQGINDWARYTCLTFSYSNTARNRMRFQNGGGCSSRVGMVGGIQAVTLAFNCRWRSVVAHEIGHAIGLNHEQTRPDRDKYVQIYYQNIPQSVRFNFQKFSWYDIINLGIPYDYLSIMHYSGNAFSSNRRITIKTLDPRYQNVIGNQHRLSFRDIKTISLMYKCSKSCSLKDSQCPGEGFVGKDCKCWCPGKPFVYCKATTGGTKPKPTTKPITIPTPKPVTKPTTKPVTDKTKVTKGCYDMHTKCDYWSKDNQCSVNPAYMLEYCKKSCKVCGDDGKTGKKVCLDKDNRCSKWVSYCNAYYYKAYMTANCQKTCGTCKSKVTSTYCADYNYYCSTWASSGYCNSANYRTYMDNNCKKSCNKCTKSGSKTTGTTAPCVNTNVHCSSWAKTGECKKNPSYMLQSCKLACNACGNGSQNVNVGTTQTSCKNLNTLCSYWAQLGRCKSHKNYMLTNCRLACGVCVSG